MTLGAAGEVSAAGELRAVGRVSVGEGKTLEEQVAFLLRRDQDVQRRFDDLDERIDERTRELRQALDEELEATHARIDYRIREAGDAYLDLRLIGVVALLFGIGLSTAGNLL